MKKEASSVKPQETDIWEQRKKEYFAQVFSQLLKKWKRKEKSEGRKGTQDEFGKKIYAHPNSISRYKNGTDFPSPSAMEAICQEFGVKEEIFYPLFDIERGGDKSFHDEKEHKLREYCESIGLDESLVAFITREEQIRNGFPFHDPKTFRPIVDSVDLFPIVQTESHFQITDRNGRTFFLEPSDLDYLRQLQTEIISFIRFKLFEERQRLREDHKELSLEYIASSSHLTKEEILSKCRFRETDYSIESRWDIEREDTQAINKAVSEIEAERGEHIIKHWKKSEIDFIFSHTITPEIHERNLQSGITEEELEEYYRECEKHEQDRKEAFIKEILEKGDVIDDG